VVSGLVGIVLGVSVGGVGIGVLVRGWTGDVVGCIEGEFGGGGDDVKIGCFGVD
jgi:hypothetical protein